MQITIVGAGPAGLYAAILLRQWQARPEVHVIEQNASDDTFGFGVVFSDQALAFLRNDDPETADLIEPEMLKWNDIDLVHRGETITIDGIGFSGVSRMRLLEILRHRATGLGARITYQQTAKDINGLKADLIIGADGINSAVRSSGNFGEEIAHLSNRFAWFGTRQPFRALTQSFIDTEFGRMNAHHYSYEPDHSTFIVEMPGEVYDRAGFVEMSADDARLACQNIFSTMLDGAPLIANRSIWRQFPVLTCRRWYDGNRVLVGDALHTAHFSIGSGTRLALEDVIALVKSLQDTHGDVEAALSRYQADRKPVLEKLTRAALASGRWYDSFAEHMDLEPWHFALSYIQRAGRIDADRLRMIAPRFSAALRARGLI